MPFHLFRYLEEESFRYNKWDGNEGDRGTQVLFAIAGRRLTYHKLIGKEPAAQGA
jgi:hypothetical protein